MLRHGVAEVVKLVESSETAARLQEGEEVMRDVDVSEMRDALSAMKREQASLSQMKQARRKRGLRLSEIKQDEERQMQRLSESLPGEAFRKGVETRLKAHDVLASHARPEVPIYTRLDTPFLIWAFRTGGPANFLGDTHIEPLNSWARFRTGYEHGGYIGPHDEVVFYFLWQNDTGSDAVVNVESQLILNGSCSIFAESGLIWSPFWGQGTIGESELWVEANLKLFEWWNQPATEPLPQPSQTHDVIGLSTGGGFALVSGTGNGEWSWLSGSYHVHYDAFLVPADAVAVFEVSLGMRYVGYKASEYVDFQSYAFESLLCPYVELEVLTASPMVSG